MSTLAFGAMTTRRTSSASGRSTSTEPPSLKTYIDSLAALVSAEVLALHDAVLTFTTKSTTTNGKVVTTITSPGVLKGSFWALVVLAVFLYLVDRVGAIGGSSGTLDRWDALRIFIPHLAFVGWTMIESNTAFDALGIK